MTQSKLKPTLFPTTTLPFLETATDFLPSNAKPQFTPEEEARDRELLRQYEEEYGPIQLKFTTSIDPDQITLSLAFLYRLCRERVKSMKENL